VARNAKFHSSPTQADRFIAANVGKKEDRQEEETALDDTK
jgi:hypothetical protein